MGSELRRADLVQRLAEVSHSTWMRQKSRDQGCDFDSLDPGVSPHEVERAQDIVAELLRLGVLRPLAG